MKKQFKISLIVLAAVLLTLALTVPGLARKPVETDEHCYVNVPILNKAGINDWAYVYGALDAYWEDETNTLYNYCAGIIPWGEELIFRTGWRFMTFNETSEFLADNIECAQSYCSTTPDIWGTEYHLIYDPIDDVYLSTNVWEVTMYRNGEFVWEKWYTPPSE